MEGHRDATWLLTEESSKDPIHQKERLRPRELSHVQGCVLWAASQMTPTITHTRDPRLFLHWECPSHSVSRLVPKFSSPGWLWGMLVAAMMDAQVGSWERPTGRDQGSMLACG